MSKRKLNAAKWYGLIEQYQSSNQSIKDFCQSESINKHSFAYWLGKYRNQNIKEGSDSEVENFITIRPLSNTGQIYIRYRSGVELELPSSYPVEHLTKLIGLRVC